MTTPEIEIKILHSLVGLETPQWAPLQDPHFPFTDLSFLKALEEAGCLGDRSGWRPFYVLAYLGTRLVGALILFAKDNSYGEYIFDFNWAGASENSGIPYYPKLVSAIPFTPATGSKILVHPSLDSSEKSLVFNALIKSSKSLLKDSDASSLHFLFIPKQETALFKEHGFFIRHSFQYHWRNNSYQCFEDFLKDLRSKRRHEVLRERSQVLKQGVKIQRLTGDVILPEHADLMYQFYLSTIEKRDGQDYLTADFFEKIFATMQKDILLVLALKEGVAVAAALNFIGDHALYGRYWGCSAEYRALHFEVCYYQGIDFCIEKGLSLFEAGAQGEHKFQRGFLPSLTYSAHSVKHAGLSRAIQDFVAQEQNQLEYLFAQYAEKTPLFPGKYLNSLD